MVSIISLFRGRLGKALSAVMTGALLIFGAIQMGKKQQKEAERVEQLEEYVETKTEIEDVEISDDSGAAFERLRDNGWLR